MNRSEDGRMKLLIDRCIAADLPDVADELERLHELATLFAETTAQLAYDKQALEQKCEAQASKILELLAVIEELEEK